MLERTAHEAIKHDDVQKEVRKPADLSLRRESLRDVKKWREQRSLYRVEIKERREKYLSVLLDANKELSRQYHLVHLKEFLTT